MTRWTIFRDLLMSVDLKPEDAGGNVEIVGADPIVPGNHRLGTMSSVALTANAVAVAALWRMRTGHGQDVRTDMRESIYTIGDNSYGINLFHDTLNGSPFAMDRALRHPIRWGTDLHELKDGRWGSLSSHYEHMLYSFLDLLGCTATPEAVTAALKKWDADELEAAAIERGVAYATVLTREEWAQREQGRFSSTRR